MTCSRWRLFLGLLTLTISGLFFRAGLAAVPYENPSSSAQDMQVRLNGVSLSILAYLQTHRPSYLEAVKTEGQAATQLLRRFRDESRGARPDLIARIETTHENQRQAAVAVLNAASAQENARQALLEEQSLLLQLLEKKLLVGTQGAVWRGSDRLRWLLTAIAEAKGFTPDAPADLVAAKSAVFHQALEKYRHETSTRQTAAIEEAQKHWDACVTGVYKIAEQENVKREQLIKFTQARADLDVALDEYRRAPAQPLPPTVRRRLLSSLDFSNGWWSLGCLIAGLGLLWPLFRVRRNNTSSIQRMTECVEAAAAGDLSRLAQVSPEAGLERLAYGLIRLSAVLMRSENLVYHLAALVESSGDAIVSQNLDGKILSWNKGAQRLYGYAMEEVRGQSIGMLSPMDQGFQLRDIVERTKAGEKINPFEALHQAKSGRLVRALVKVSAIHDSLRQVIGVSFCAQELLSGAPSSTAPLTDTLQRS